MKAPEKPLVQYWDSSVFVAFFNDEAGRADTVSDLLDTARAGGLTIITSSFSFVEVLRIKNQKRLTEKDERTLHEFFDYPFIKAVDATRGICEAARHLIWKYPALWPKDSVHFASSIEYGSRLHIDHLFSYDSDFLKLNGIVTRLFPICEPFVSSPLLWSNLPTVSHPSEDGVIRVLVADGDAEGVLDVSETKPVESTASQTEDSPSDEATRLPV